jgi:hypothetical protein
LLGAHDLFVRAGQRAFWEVHEARADLVGGAHQAADLLPAVSQRRGIAGISVDGDLRDGKPQGLEIPVRCHLASGKHGFTLSGIPGPGNAGRCGGHLRV